MRQKKIVIATGAEPRESISRVVDTLEPLVKPELTQSVGVDNPVEVMKEEFDREFPGLSMLDMDVRPYLIAESDRNVSPDAPLMKVPLVDDVVPQSKFLSTGFSPGVSGPRPRSVAEVVSAFTSRVAGAPSYQWEIDLERSMLFEFERFAAVYLKDDWREIVDRRVSKGYMYPSEHDIRRVVGKMSQSNVTRVINENFRCEGILMTVLKAMVKREPKDRQDLSVAFEHKPNQTIMYQDSKVINAYFSASLGNFHDLMDEVLKPGMLINPRIDKADVEKFWNAASPLCVPELLEELVNVDVDISQCDKSHTTSNILRYMYLLCQFGFGDFVKIWELMVQLKRAADPTTHVLTEFLAQVISGFFNTISANSCIVAWGTVNSIDVSPKAFRRITVSGDDVVATVVTDDKLDLSHVTHRFSTVFNFDAKITVNNDVVYWCGRLGVECDGYVFFVKDPGRVRSSFFKSQGPKYDPEEAWESFLDDTMAYENEELVVGVAQAYAKRRGLDFVPIGTARAIAALRRNKKAFVERFESLKVIG
jgi:hypothetical protein